MLLFPDNASGHCEEQRAVGRRGVGQCHCTAAEQGATAPPPRPNERRSAERHFCLHRATLAAAAAAGMISRRGGPATSWSPASVEHYSRHVEHIRSLVARHTPLIKRCCRRRPAAVIRLISTFDSACGTSAPEVRCLRGARVCRRR